MACRLPFAFNEEARNGPVESFNVTAFQSPRWTPRKAGSTMNEGLVWLVWIPVSVILLVLLINTFIIV